MKFTIELSGGDELAFRRAFGRFVDAQLGPDHHTYRKSIARWFLVRAAEAVAVADEFAPGDALRFDARAESAEERAVVALLSSLPRSAVAGG